MSQVHMVVGGQFGSEGKGAFTYALTRREHSLGREPIVIRTGGPNAGHTVWREQQEWKLRQVPAGMLAANDIIGCIAAGSEVDENVLYDEIHALEAAGIPIQDRLIVDPSATLIEAHHLRMETELVKEIGSTGKGIGAARAQRIMREATLYGDRGQGSVMRQVWKAASFDNPIIIEGTQGYGLGLHTPYYPKVTSRDVRGVDLLSEVGIPPTAPFRFTPWVVYRPHPIRVAGESGPLKGETSWADLNLPVERTTVTKKIRRVGEWDRELVENAIIANGRAKAHGVHMFLDYVFPDLFEQLRWSDIATRPEVLEYIQDIDRQIGTVTMAYGTGPTTMIWR